MIKISRLFDWLARFVPVIAVIITMGAVAWYSSQIAVGQGNLVAVWLSVYACAHLLGRCKRPDRGRQSVLFLARSLPFLLLIPVVMAATAYAVSGLALEGIDPAATLLFWFLAPIGAGLITWGVLFITMTENNDASVR